MPIQQDPDLAPPPVAAAGAASTPHLENGRAVPVDHAWQWIMSGWRLFRRQPVVWLLLGIVFGLIFFALGVVPVLGQIAVTVLLPVFGGGMMRACRRVDAGEELELADLFWGFRHQTGPLVTVGAISLALTIAVLIPTMLLTGAGAALTQLAGGASEAAVAVLVGLLVFFAFVIPIYMGMWFAPALVVFEERAPAKAMMQSFRACLKNAVPFLAYGVILLVLGIFASIPFGLGWLVLGPVMVGSVYASYRDIFGRQ